jgi:hypothetical protein
MFADGEWLDAIRSRIEQASPAPWRVVTDELNHYIVDSRGELVTGLADAEFIAAARKDVEVLVSEVERLDRLLEALREWAEYAKACAHEVTARDGPISGKGLKEGFFLSFGADRVLAILDGDVEEEAEVEGAP